MLEMLKRLLGITDDSQDALLSQLLDESQSYVEDFLERNLDLGDYQDVIEPNGSTSIWLRNYPVQSVESIESLDGRKVSDFKVIKATGLVRTNTNLIGDYIIEYKGGFETIPPWAMKAIVDTAASLYGQQGAAGTTGGVAIGAVKSEEIVGVAKVTYETGSSSGSSSQGSSGASGSLSVSTIETLERHKNRHA